MKSNNNEGLKTSRDYSAKIHLAKGDYLDHCKNSDVIVNITNCSLLPMEKSNEIEELIYKELGADGETVKAELMHKRGCRPGEAVITGSYALEKKYSIRNIVHVVSPHYYKTDRLEERKILAGCFTSALNCAMEEKRHSIVFPCIWLEQKGNECRESTRIAFNSVISWLDRNNDYDISITFSCKNDKNQEDYYRILQVILRDYRNTNRKFIFDTDPDKIGLVLQGGGAKGAFAFGAYKVLCDNGLFDKITGISGTSIGALNTALFLSQIEKKEQFWLEFEQKYLTKDKKKLKLKEKLQELFLQDDKEEWNGNRDVFSTVSIKGSRLTYDYRSWTGKTIECIKSLVIGSAAHPAIFQPETGEDHGKKEVYIDGGTVSYGFLRGEKSDTNVPIQPLYDIGYRKFIVVYLNPYQDEVEQINDEYVRYGDADFCRVFPEESLGEMNKISKELTEARIQKGKEAMEHEIADGNPVWWRRVRSI